MVINKTGWLTGWKEIAAYIGTSIETAKKYNKLHKMPVRRGPYNTAHALPYELDNWLIENNEISPKFSANMQP